MRPVIGLAQLIRRKYVHQVVMSPHDDSAFALFGTSRWRQRYARTYFSDDNAIRIGYRLHGSSWVRQSRYLLARHGLVVVHESPAPAALEDTLLRVPDWIAMRVDLRESEAAYRAVIGSMARGDLQRIHSKGFSADVINDPEWADRFFHDYHRPSMQDRHGDDGFVMSPDDMRALMRTRRMEFLRITLQGQHIGAALNECSAAQYSIGRVGWLHGDPAWQKVSVMAAIFWHSMQRARHLGLRYVQLGGTPPFVDDGVFAYKSKWGAALDRTETRWGEHGLLLSPGHPHAKRVLHKRAFVVLNGADEFVVLSGRQPQDVKMSRDTAQSIARWYQLREAPDTAGEDENHDLPRTLRAWFRAVEIPQAQ